MFDSDNDVLILDLPAAEPKVVDGWKILPMTHPKVQLLACSQAETLYNY